MGFIKFNDEAKPDVEIRKVKCGGNKLRKRHDLNEVDQSNWPVVDGKPKDPGQPIMQLPMVSAIGELVVFSAIGEGGARDAVCNLCGVYDRSLGSGLLPIV